MNGKQHLALGAASGIALSAALIMSGENGIVSSGITSVEIIAMTSLGELYPDIDLETTKIGHMVKPVSHLLNKLFGHRGFIHTPVNCCICTAVLYFILSFILVNPAVPAAAFAFGFILHLIQDTLTKGGIKWLWPLPFKIHLTNFASGSMPCWILTALLCVLVFAVAFVFPETVISVFSSVQQLLENVFAYVN